MIRNFGNRLAEDLFYDLSTRETRKFPPELRRPARKKLFMVHSAGILDDLKIPLGNRLEALKGNLKGSLSIRINDQWRIVFMWVDTGAQDVKVVDYH